MKLYQFSERQLQQYVVDSLFPEHVKHFFFKMLNENVLRLTEYLSSIFNLGYIPHYTPLAPSSVFQYEYDHVIRDFEVLRDKLRQTEIFTIYGVDPLDAIYYHAGYSNGYDGFSGYFHDDLYSLMETVDPDNCMDYMQEITTLVRYLIEVLERFYVHGRDSETSVYISVASTPEVLTILAR